MFPVKVNLTVKKTKGGYYVEVADSRRYSKTFDRDLFEAIQLAVPHVESLVRATHKEWQ